MSKYKPTIATHTLVRNGMPFIDLVLRQLIPYVNKCYVTISVSSTDETESKIQSLNREFKHKLSIVYEDVDKPGQLTLERQLQADNTTEDWIWFLDDDDYWPKEYIEKILPLLNDDIDGLAFSPYQLMSKKFHDSTWANKWFTKIFKNKDIKYKNPWPRDIIFTGGTPLYWKHNLKVIRKPDIKYFHLSSLKNDSFRDSEKFKKDYKQTTSIKKMLPENENNNIKNIYECINNNIVS